MARRPARDSVAASELARMVVCEAQIVLDGRHGARRSLSVAVRRWKGTYIHRARYRAVQGYLERPRRVSLLGRFFRWLRGLVWR